MNRERLITFLLFLLLLLIILCTWFHSEDIAKNRASKVPSPTTTIATVKNDPTTHHPINFYLKKDKEQFELGGDFAKKESIEKLQASLNKDNLNNLSHIDEALEENPEVILLVEEIIPVFHEKYMEGSIVYEDEKLIIMGIVENRSDKDEMSALLANSKLPTYNDTHVIEKNSTTLHTTTKEKSSHAEVTNSTNSTAQSIMQEPITATKEQAEKGVIELEAEIQEVIDLENINFELNEATLTKESLQTLKHIANILQKYPSVNVEIAGHTDNLGEGHYNLDLSQRRVDSVKQQLESMGVETSRLKAIGYGEENPLVSNDTKENRCINRRVEFKIIGE